MENLKEGLKTMPIIRVFRDHPISPCLHKAIIDAKKSDDKEFLRAACKYQCGCTCLCPNPPCLRR